MRAISKYGEIVATENIDNEYPGIWVSIGGEKLVLVDIEEETGKASIRVWDNQEPDEDYVYSQEFFLKEVAHDE